MGSFYNHFDSKEELFEAAVTEVLDMHGALLDELTSSIAGPCRDVRAQFPFDWPTVPASPAGESDPARARSRPVGVGARAGVHGRCATSNRQRRPDDSRSTIPSWRWRSRRARCSGSATAAGTSRTVTLPRPPTGSPRTCFTCSDCPPRTRTTSASGRCPTYRRSESLGALPISAPWS